MENKPLLKATDLSMVYPKSGKSNDLDKPDKLVLFDQISLTVQPGESISLTGQSGAGKTTLLSILSGIRHPTEGEVYFDSLPLSKLSETQRSRFLNEKVGFVYQFHHLLPELTALENVIMPLLIRGQTPKASQKEGAFWLEQVGLGQRIHQGSQLLSGGERQRVAIARAMIGKPSCVFLDEPTGNLDLQTACQTKELILSLQKQYNTAFIIVTHDRSWALQTDRGFHLCSEGLLPRESLPA